VVFGVFWLAISREKLAQGKLLVVLQAL